MIVGDGNLSLISFDTVNQKIEKTEIQIKKKDYFGFVYYGFEENNKMYLCGDKHLHILDLTTNQFRVIRRKGIDNNESSDEDQFF